MRPARARELLLERNTSSLSIVFLPGDFVFRLVPAIAKECSLRERFVSLMARNRQVGGERKLRRRRETFSQRRVLNQYRASRSGT